MVVILDNGRLEEMKISMAQVKVNYQTKKLYIMTKFLNIEVLI